MTKAPTQSRAGKGTLVRCGVILVIVITHFTGWFWLSGFTRDQGELELVDRLLCPVTFVSCAGPGYASSWMLLLVVNAVAFVVWMLFLLGARGFIVGTSLGGRLLGLSVSLLIPLAVLAVFFMGLVISSIS